MPNGDGRFCTRTYPIVVLAAVIVIALLAGTAAAYVLLKL